jgi:hypothetical protein
MPFRLTTRNKYLLFLGALFIINLFWFYKLGFRTLMGDDLVGWNYYSSVPSFIKATLLNFESNKYRPIFAIASYITFKLFKYDYGLFFYFNILFNFAIICVLYTLILKINKNNHFMAFALSIAYITSRFAYYNILQVTGLIEALSLFLLLLTLHFAVDFYKTHDVSKLLFGILMYCLLIYTHERYIVIGAFLFLLIIFKRPRFLTLWLGLVAFVPTLNMFLKKFVFNIRALEGTGGVALAFNPVTFFKFLIAGFLNMFGINVGPEYLNGIAYRQVNSLTDWCIGLIILMIIALWGLSFVSTDKTEKKKRLTSHLQIQALFLVLFFSLLAVSSITIRQELRWLYAPFVVFLLFVSYLLAKIRVSTFVKYILVVLLISLFVRNDVYYKQYVGNIYFSYCQKIADSMYDQSIGKYGRSITDYKVYIVKDENLSWPLLGSLFFHPYLGDSFTVNYIESTADIKQLPNKEKIIVYKLDWPSRSIKQVDLLNSQ